MRLAETPMRKLILALPLIALLAAAPSHARSACAVGEAISVNDLPAQGRTTLALIAAGGPFPNGRDGVIFGNRERLLPKAPRGFYHEYTVRTPGVRHRGARRIVCGGAPRTPDACYFTSDHYASFREIRE